MRNLKNRLKFSISFRWYDFWIGWYWDRENRAIYICLLPMLPIRISIQNAAEDDDDEIMYCQDCGRMILWDCKHSDDIVRRAYVTASGDLFCDLCGREYDLEEERQSEAEAYPWYDPMDDIEQIQEEQETLSEPGDEEADDEEV
jgi:hypothetical protein